METAFGTLLKRGDGGSPEAFTTIAELSNVDGPITRDEIDGTHHSSPGAWRQWKPGLKSMEITFEGNYLPTDPTHDAATGLLADFDAGSIKNYRIEWPIGGVTWTAPCLPA